MKEKHEAMAQALIAHCERNGISLLVAHEHDFIQSARRGIYAEGNPIGPGTIGMTQDEFTALRALIYG